MQNWNIDISKFKTRKAKKIWELEQKINYGVKKSKLTKKELVKYLPELKIDEDKKKFIEFILQ